MPTPEEEHDKATCGSPPNVDRTNPTSHTHICTQDKTNEDGLSFTRQCRQALIKHAWLTLPSDLPAHTHL